MEAINQSERTTSLINFVAVYILILSVPLFLAFFAGTRRSAGLGKATDVKEYELLQKQMTDLQAYTATMRQLDDKLTNMNNASPAGWQAWLDDSKKENQRFSDAIEKFRKVKFNGARTLMQTSACTYLDALHTERGIHLQYLERQRGIQNQSLTVEQLKEKNNQLQSTNASLQNTINTQNAILAQKPAPGAGGAPQNTQALTDLKWQLRFEDADCKKSQADVLAAHNEEVARRKQLYSSAKVNFQQISQLAKSSFTIQRLASAKVREIDQTLSRL